MATRLQHIPGMLPHRPLATCLYLTAGCFGLLYRPFLSSPDDEAAQAAARSPACAPAPAEAAPEAPSAAASCSLRLPPVNVVDVAASAATPELISQLIRLEGDERVSAVDDQPAANDLAAGALIAARVLDRPAPAFGPLLVLPRGAIHRGDYIDLTIHSDADDCSRRVLVLFH
jgi:hypothetical protein